LGTLVLGSEVEKHTFSLRLRKSQASQ